MAAITVYRKDTYPPKESNIKLSALDFNRTLLDSNSACA